MKKGNNHQPFQQNDQAEKMEEKEEGMMEDKLTSPFEPSTRLLFLLSSTIGLRSNEIKELFISDVKGGI